MVQPVTLPAPTSPPTPDTACPPGDLSASEWEMLQLIAVDAVIHCLREKAARMSASRREEDPATQGEPGRRRSTGL